MTVADLVPGNLGTAGLALVGAVLLLTGGTAMVQLVRKRPDLLSIGTLQPFILSAGAILFGLLMILEAVRGPFGP